MRKFLGAALLCSGVAQASDNIVVNPGFEAPAGWQTSGSGAIVVTTLRGRGADKGVAYTACILGCQNLPGKGSYMGQTLATQAGEFYDFSFWAQSDQPGNWLSAFWDGQLLTPQRRYLDGSDWTQFRFSHLQASSPLTRFEVHSFTGLNTIRLDDFIVVLVPEPARAAMLAAGLGMLALAVRRRRLSRPSSPG
ncbi:PEP-CTERM sorting domain-containing protein [Massilia endophytica]|uniref:PEP-CTERM sorting domain-containing protein n=1 Tax=Massilia endophytica TaxID=2899220 RepID=UPI001E2E03E4|nr:PEP-CTERM sorting domain-containing protein [Massilia endophytica]UGQ46465.1 PEP-CTERM sorting domain-containing protein [Massilia endophytica]